MESLHSGGEKRQLWIVAINNAQPGHSLELCTQCTHYGVCPFEDQVRRQRPYPPAAFADLTDFRIAAVPCPEMVPARPTARQGLD